MGRSDDQNPGWARPPGGSTDAGTPGDEFGSMYDHRGRFREERSFGGMPYDAGDRSGGHPGHRDFGGQHAYDNGHGHPSHRTFGRGDRDDPGRHWHASGHPGGHRGKGPTGYVRSDDRIRDDICERLTEHDAIDASRIQVAVSEGVVTLSGEVPQRYMKHLTEDSVAATTGVRDVENGLRVRGTGDA
jgi:hypothetical protein